MKDNQLAVTVRGIARKIYLRAIGGQWGIRFTPGITADKGPRKIVERRLGFEARKDPAILKAAKEKAAEILDGFFPNSEGQVVARALKLRNGFATIGELLDAYDPRISDVRSETRWKNKCSLIKVLKDVFKLTTREQVESLSTAVLTEETALRFLKLRERRGTQEANGNQTLITRALVSANSTLRQARSVISKKLECFAELNLPDFSGFRNARLHTVKRIDLAYNPPSYTIFEQMDADIREPGVRPQLRLAYLLMRNLGLRNSEVWPARWNWIDKVGGRWVFRIMERSDFCPKVGKRDIPIEPGFKAELDALRGTAHPNAWIIDFPFRTDREEFLRYDLNDWMRRYIPRCDSEKCAYVLRKQAGSQVYDRFGLQAAAAFLGDTPETTQRHYLRHNTAPGGVEYNGPMNGFASARSSIG